MFGDMMGNMQERQKELKEKLSNITLIETFENIVITGTAARKITNVDIPIDFISPERKDELEDLLTIAINNFIEKVGIEEGKASQNMINDLLPGMGNMLGM